MISQIYVENGVGRAAMDAINLFTVGHGVTAVWQHDVHPDMQRKQYGDECLATIFRLNARDEIAHCRFYEDVVKEAAAKGMTAAK